MILSENQTMAIFETNKFPNIMVLEIKSFVRFMALVEKLRLRTITISKNGTVPNVNR